MVLLSREIILPFERLKLSICFIDNCESALKNLIDSIMSSNISILNGFL